MNELHSDAYRAVSRLFATYGHHKPIFSSVLEGRRPGSVFVDNLEKPLTSLLYVGGVWSYFAGDSSQIDFVKDAIEGIFSRTPDELREVVVFSPDETWRSVLDDVLAERHAIRIYRKTFDFDVEAFSAGESAADETPPPADSGLIFHAFETGEGGNFGVRAMRGVQAIAECKSVFVGGGCAEIAVKTEEDERRRGYAHLVCRAFIAECLSRRLTPCWGCWPYNEPSEKLAVKLGFTPADDLPAHFWEVGM